MLSLQKLTLELQYAIYLYSVTERPSSYAWAFWERKEQEDMRAATREVSINAAIDEGLARSKFAEIMTVNAAAHRTLLSKLSYIKLRMAGALAVKVQMMNQGFQGILRWT